MNIITAQQSRDARRELGLSQADITNALGFTRQYLSEFETGFSTRLTNAQLKKLRTFYENKIKEANAAGESIALNFENETQVLPDKAPQPVIPLSQVTLAIRHLAVDDSLNQEQIKAILDKVSQNDDAAAELMTEKVERGFTSDWNESTDETIKELFGRFAENYVLIRHLQGRQIVVLEQPIAYGDIKTVGDLFSYLFHDDNSDLLASISPTSTDESKELNEEGETS